jgi:hypothetical protein
LPVQHAQRASGEGRFHARSGAHWDPALGWATAGAVHHDDLSFPIRAPGRRERAAQGFDQGRNELEARFAAAGHATSRVWWGNTQSFKQCDGDFAASDGWTTYVRLHQVNHA